VPVDNITPHSRRAILAAGIGGALATLATAMGRPPVAEAANGDPLAVGQTTTATAVTELTVTGAAVDALRVGIAQNQATGTALSAFSSNGTTIRASNSSFLPTISAMNIGALNAGPVLFAVTGSSGSVPTPQQGVAVHVVQTDSQVGRVGLLAQANGTGVEGIAGDTGVFGSGQQHGLHGLGMSLGTGVTAESDGGIGVDATSGSHEAVRARTASTSLPGLSSQATGGKSAIQGFAGSGAVPPPASDTGVQGRADSSVDSVGVLGESTNGTGVFGDTSNGYGVAGVGYYGVYGTGAAGVVGDVDGGTGVQGWSGSTVAPAPVARVGVWAGAQTGRTALQVSGVVKLSRSGRATFASGTRTKKVAVSGGIVSTAFAFANLQASRTGIYVTAVVPTPSSSSITIYLNKAVSSKTVVGWLVVG
jgi:hypothetical protein